MTNIDEIRAWLQDSRGQHMPNGTSKLLEISRRSKVSLRTISNICSDTEAVPRRATIAALENVRKRMVKK